MRSALSRVQKPRWQRRPAQRPDEILDAALCVFTRRGLHQTTLEEVAKEAGISKGTIYLYFKNKEELFVAAAQRVVPRPDELFAAESATAGSRLTFPSLLHELARTAYRRFRTPAYLAFFSMMAAETLRHPEWGELYFRRVVLGLNRRVAEIFTHAIRTGQCRKVDPLLVSRAFVGMFLMMALSQEHLGGKRYTPLSEEKVIHALTDVFLRGLVPAGARQV